MKILFINGAYPKECVKRLAEGSYCPLQTPQDVFQWNIIDGLQRNNIEFDSVCLPFIPAYPNNSSIRNTPYGEMYNGGSKIGEYLSFNNTLGIKQVSRKRVLYGFLKKWCEKNKSEDKLIFLIYTTSTDFLVPAIRIKKKLKNVLVCAIVADLIDEAMNYAANRTVLKRLQWIIEKRAQYKAYEEIDKYVLLTRHMVEKIPEAKDSYFVMEGIASCSNQYNTNHRVTNTKSVLYAGTLEPFSCINLLVDAFMLTKDPSYRLIICGNGSCEDYIKKKQLIDERIIYNGSVTREEVLFLQREATLLVNPRQPDGRITKYSFPSKTMEYLLSGTPMLGYRLEGIPEEYFNYIYSPADGSVLSLKNTLENCLSKSQEELDLFAKSAQKFIREEKNAMKQVAGIVDFLKR